MSESTISLLISGFMGILGGLITIPVNAFFTLWLKKREIEYEHRFEALLKKKELLWQHKLELQKIEFEHRIKQRAGDDEERQGESK